MKSRNIFALVALVALIGGATFYDSYAQIPAPGPGGAAAIPPSLPTAFGGPITFPDGSVGNVSFRFSWNGNLTVLQTIPDAVGRGMKTKLTLWSTWNCTETCNGTVIATNP